MTAHEGTRHGSSDEPARQYRARDSRTEQLVSALIEKGVLAPDRRGAAVLVVDAALAAQSPTAGPFRRRLAELAGYVGAAFVLAAAAVFSASRWDSLSAGQQVAMLGAVAVLLAGIGLALCATTGAGRRAGRDPVRRRLAGTLLTGSAAAAAGAVGLAVDRAHGGTGSAAGVLAFATLAAVSLLGYLAAPTVLGQVAVAVGVATAVPMLVDELGQPQALGSGIGILGLGAGWLLATERGLWREIASARVVGSALAVLGAQLLVVDSGTAHWAGYLATAAVGVAAFAGYVARPAWPYLAAGVVAVTLVVPEALLDWTGDALGPAGGLLVTGVTLLVAAVLGLRLRKEVAEQPAS